MHNRWWYNTIYVRVYLYVCIIDNMNQLLLIFTLIQWRKLTCAYPHIQMQIVLQKAVYVCCDVSTVWCVCVCPWFMYESHWFHIIISNWKLFLCILLCSYTAHCSSVIPHQWYDESSLLLNLLNFPSGRIDFRFEKLTKLMPCAQLLVLHDNL